MTDSHSSFDYGADLVARYRASGLSRRDFSAQSGIAVSTLDYYVRRERKAALPVAKEPNHILPVDVVFAPQAPAARSFSIPEGGIAVHLFNGRTVEVRRGFDAELLLEVLSVLEAERTGERD